MNQSEKFIINDIKMLHDFINKYGFAIVCANNSGDIHVSSIPLILTQSQFADKLCLTGHIANTNQLKKIIMQESRVKVIFNGPHAYISPTWYTNGGVPTWNYATVHVDGIFKPVSNSKLLLNIINKMTAKYENQRMPSWNTNMLPKTQLDKMLDAILGFEISIEEIYGKFKLSQNKSILDKNNVIHGLTNENDIGSQNLAKFMTNLF